MTAYTIDDSMTRLTRVNDGETIVAHFYGPNSAQLARDFVALPELLEVLAAIVYEYDQTFDAECDTSSASWTSAASIPVEVMQRAERLVRAARREA